MEIRNCSIGMALMMCFGLSSYGETPLRLQAEIDLARNEIQRKHPEITPDRLVLSAANYSWRQEPGRAKPYESLLVEFYDRLTVSNAVYADEKVIYFTEFEATVNPGSQTVSVREPKRSFRHEAKSFTASGTAEAEGETVLEPRVEAFEGVVRQLMGEPERVKLSKLLQYFCDLTGESVVVPSHFIAMTSVIVVRDSEPRDVDEALRLIIAALGAEHFFLQPEGPNRSRIMRSGSTQ